MTIKKLTTRKASIVMLIALVVNFAFICMTKSCFSAAMVFIVSEGILTKFETGVISAAFYFVYAIFQLVGGVLVDKFKAERLITIGFIGTAAANLVIYLNQNYILMLIVWAISGAFQFGVWPAVFKMASTTLSDDLTDNGLFVISLATPLGSVLSYIIAAIVNTRWQLNFLVSAVGLTVLALIWEFLNLKLQPYTVEIKPIIPEKNEECKESSVGFFALVFASGFIFVFFIGLIRTLFDLGIKALVPSMISESYSEVSPVVATVISITIIVASALGTFLARFVYPKHIHDESIALLVFLFASLPFVLLMLLIGKISYWLILLFLAMIVLAMGTACLFVNIFIARFAKYGKVGTVMGMLNCGAALGIVVANTLLTAVADARGWGATIVVLIIMNVIAIVLSAIFIPFRRKFVNNT